MQGRQALALTVLLGVQPKHEFISDIGGRRRGSDRQQRQQQRQCPAPPITGSIRPRIFVPGKARRRVIVGTMARRRNAARRRKDRGAASQ